MDPHSNESGIQQKIQESKQEKLTSQIQRNTPSRDESAIGPTNCDPAISRFNLHAARQQG
jgi:hypothetical protein